MWLLIRLLPPKNVVWVDIQKRDFPDADYSIATFAPHLQFARIVSSHIETERK
jgi:hypothetical protein